MRFDWLDRNPLGIQYWTAFPGANRYLLWRRMLQDPFVGRADNEPCIWRSGRA